MKEKRTCEKCNFGGRAYRLVFHHAGQAARVGGVRIECRIDPAPVVRDTVEPCARWAPCNEGGE